MKVLIFDTETTGLPEENNVSILETFRWPFIVQLSFIYYDSTKNKVLKVFDEIIKLSDNKIIPFDSTKIHGITNEIMNKKGIEIKQALKSFMEVLKDCDVVVGHNISFDKRMIMVECIRNKISQYFTRGNDKKPEYCTMKNSKNICKILMTNYKGETYFKNPKLCELYNHIFKEEPKNLHNSFVDVLICLRCYFAIIENKDILNESEIKKLFLQYNI